VTLPQQKATIFVPGGQLLSELKVERFNVCLGGGSGAGKSTGSVSFGGGEYGKIIYFLIEHGQLGGAGGALPLKFLKGINETIHEDEILVLSVASWGRMQAQFKWLCQNTQRLYDEGYRVMVWDGITELALMISDALQVQAPDTVSEKGAEQGRNIARTLVTDIDLVGGREMVQSDYGLVGSRMRSAIKRAKWLPFTFIATAQDGPLYDENQSGEDAVPIGIGPALVGRKVVNRLLYAFDFYFHCDVLQTKTVDPSTKKLEITQTYRWLTQDQSRGKGNPPYFAKSRAGYALEKYEKPDGRAMLSKLGFKPAPMGQGGV